MPLGPFAPIPPREKIRRSHINDLRTALTGIQDAYDVAVANGFTGTRGQWLDSLKGEKGDPGAGLAPIGSVETVDDLPGSGNTVGDVRTADDTGRAYRWDGSAWIDVGLFRGPGGVDTELRARLDPGTAGSNYQAAGILNGVPAWLSLPEFSVRWFGAKGDGTSDDTNAINACIAAVSALGGGTVFFPEGTYIVSPTGTSRFLTLASNITYRGAGYASCVRVAAANPDYQSVFRPPATGTRVENVLFTNLRIDQNAAAQTTTGNPLSAGAQNAIRAQNVRSLAVDGCWFDTCTGVNTVLLNGGGFTDTSDFRVQRSFFRFVALPNATNPTPQYKAYDNSAVYFSNGERGHVLGNTFVSPVPGARGTCEFHGPRMTYADNIVDGYETMINLGTQSGWDEAEWTVTGNTGRNLNIGVRAMCANTATHRSIRITNNSLHINSGLHGYDQSQGITVTSGITTDGDVSMLDISHNTVYFEPDARTQTWDGSTLAIPQYFYGIGVQIAATVRGGTISDNVVVNAPVTAIRLGASAGQYRSLSVQRNVLDTPGHMDAWTTNRTWISMAGNFTDCEITDNQLIDTRDAGTNQRVWLNAQNLDTCRNTWVDRNWRKDTGVGNWSSTTTFQPAGTWTKIYRTFSRATIDPASIAAGGESTHTITHGGARVEDTVTATPNGALEGGLVYFARVSAADTIMLHIRNVSSAAVDPASRMWRFHLHRTPQDQG